MFDISWTEFLLIGVVALIFIGPKELPAVLRTLGQWTRRIRSMAADFQNQFQEAMREAEMADLKKQVDDIAHDIKSYDPLKDVRSDIEAAGRDIQSSLEKPATEGAASEAAAPDTPALPDAAVPAIGPVAPEAVTEADKPIQAVGAVEADAPAPDDARDAAMVAAPIAPVVPEAVATASNPDAPAPDPAGRQTAGPGE
jgi:sec-independent protein translocase protein TatB